MRTKNYKPSMVPVIEKDGRIRITVECGLSDVQEITLWQQLAGESICPRLYWFHDTPEVRRILQFAGGRVIEPRFVPASVPFAVLLAVCGLALVAVLMLLWAAAGPNAALYFGGPLALVAVIASWGCS